MKRKRVATLDQSEESMTGETWKRHVASQTRRKKVYIVILDYGRFTKIRGVYASMEKANDAVDQVEEWARTKAVQDALDVVGLPRHDGSTILPVVYVLTKQVY